MTVEWWTWVAFVSFITAMLLLDLFVVHRNAHQVTVREAAAWSGVWIALGLAFAGLVWAWGGPTAGGEYLAGYLIEKSLSIDNIFVFALILSSFGVPTAYQHRVLFWGVFGALVLRGLFIAAGAALLEHVHWTIYVFGAFLVLTGVRMLRHRGVALRPERNPLLRLLRGVVPISREYDGQRLLTRQAGRRVATPLLVVLLVVETTDLLFAVDSIPAIFAVTTSPFLVFSSNAFAVLGLRALYFLLAGMIERFVHLRIGLAAVLVFVGARMLVSDVYAVPIWKSLLVIAALVGASVASSLWSTRGAPRSSPERADPLRRVVMPATTEPEMRPSGR